MSRRSKWHCMGVSLNAGGAMEWLRALLAGFSGDQRAVRRCGSRRSRPGRRLAHAGLLFLPYLNGERCPHPDPAARGGFVGLSAGTVPAEMARSVMEGVTHSLYDIFSLMQRGQCRRQRHQGLGRRRALGAVAADAGRSVRLRGGDDRGRGRGRSLRRSACRRRRYRCLVELRSRRQRSAARVTREMPDPVAGKAMHEAFQIYRDLYGALSPSFAALGEAGLDR